MGRNVSIIDRFRALVTEFEVPIYPARHFLLNDEFTFDWGKAVLRPLYVARAAMLRSDDESFDSRLENLAVCPGLISDASEIQHKMHILVRPFHDAVCFEFGANGYPKEQHD
jgi:hypothetical protein